MEHPLTASREPRTVLGARRVVGVDKQVFYMHDSIAGDDRGPGDGVGREMLWYISLSA